MVIRHWYDNKDRVAEEVQPSDGGGVRRVARGTRLAARRLQLRKRAAAGQRAARGGGRGAARSGRRVRGAGGLARYRSPRARATSCDALTDGPARTTTRTRTSPGMSDAPLARPPHSSPLPAHYLRHGRHQERVPLW